MMISNVMLKFLFSIVEAIIHNFALIKLNLWKHSLREKGFIFIVGRHSIMIMVRFMVDNYLLDMIAY